MLSGDGLRYSIRNLFFTCLIIVIFGSLYGVYFDLNIQDRNNPLYLSFFIMSNLLFFSSLILLIVDSLSDRDLKMEKKAEKDRMKEMEKISERFPESSGEIPTQLVGKVHNYFNNAFEKNGNLWRTLLYLMVAIFVYVSFMITFFKHSNNTRNTPGYISSISLSNVSLAIYFGMLLYQLIEFSKLDKKGSVNEIRDFKNKNKNIVG
jgi:predicted membrane channel-forming protein YqfA (hemolysin III family)